MIGRLSNSTPGKGGHTVILEEQTIFVDVVTAIIGIG